ncbi:hypothetical protein FG386_002893 [Cryptosporidium ryanae]|uniref:uncharacterized protein n=1 Tax=Cryptosporidium ryanae TaxID=515981 RepID=UPI00351A53B6|nr:hypothetical protein FG386_002893 [Cryptosporidium ryanae]
MHNTVGGVGLCVKCSKIMCLNFPENSLKCGKSSRPNEEYKASVNYKVTLRDIKNIEKRIFRKLVNKKSWFSIKSFFNKYLRAKDEQGMNSSNMTDEGVAELQLSFYRYEYEYLEFCNLEYSPIESNNGRRNTYDVGLGLGDYYQEYNKYKRNISVDETRLIKNKDASITQNVDIFENKSRLEKYNSNANCQAYKDKHLFKNSENYNNHNIISKNPFNYCQNYTQ